MTNLTRASLTTALVLFVLGFVVAESTAVASQRAAQAGARISAADTAIGGAQAARWQNRQIVVRRKSSPAIVFTDDRAIAFDITLTQAKIEGFESALAKDLANGDFRARQTRRVVNIRRHQAAESTPEKLLAARRDLNRLELALRQDIANGDFRGPRTRSEVARSDGLPSVAGEDALAGGAISLSDDIWSLEMAVEKDLHAHNFRAIETHFFIDARRWKVR